MSLSLHCDREGCDSWQRDPNPEHDTWLCVNGGPDFDREHHFCNLDCLMHWAAANSEPTTVVEP